MPPGHDLYPHDLYPHDLTRDRIDQYVKQHPEDKAAIYNPYTVGRNRSTTASQASIIRMNTKRS